MNTRIKWLVPCVTAAVSLLGIHALSAQEARAPKPGPEHKRLGYFVGNWTTEESGPGGKITAVDRCEWFEGHFAVVCHTEEKSPGSPGKSMHIFGYSAEEKVYTYYGIYSWGETITTVPRGTLQGDTWIYNSEHIMDGKKVKLRNTITEISPTEQRFKFDKQTPDGKWETIAEGKRTKTK
jgi:hypothetical protein